MQIVPQDDRKGQIVSSIDLRQSGTQDQNGLRFSLEKTCFR